MKKPRRYTIVLIIILFILFVSYRYNDLKYIIFYEFSFMEEILNFPEMKFYQYCMQQYELYGFESGACMALWGMPIYTILGVWGIPLYFISKISQLDIYQLIKKMPVVVYGKLILIVFLIMTLIVLMKMIKSMEVKNDLSLKKTEIALLFFSSYFVAAPVFIQGQSDIIEIFFMMLGIYFLTVCKKKWMFIFMFLLSVSLKQMSLLYFIPVLLMIEKKIWKIILQIGIVVSPVLLNRLLFGGPLDLSVNLANVQQILANKLPFLKGDIPLFFILYFGLCAVNYFMQKENDIVENMHKIWLTGLIVYGSINLFSNQIYRCIYVAPFLLLCVTFVRTNAKQVIFLETILEGCYAFYQICNYVWCFDITNCKYMLPEKLFGILKPDSSLIMLEDFTRRFSSVWLDVIAGSAVIILTIIIGYLVLAKNWKRIAIPYIEEMSLDTIIFFRINLIGLIGLAPIVLYALNIILR